ncbi:hypothetical protein HPB47_024477 [Ixodes persulcatus]|uniref:Uncharacterized protein n=1 Tax=Ixodes persulcatus TaxID=34615 RepID=A0AC60Q492_IXOPE|nr:hypothetical protein HPB47_024477 [Ixodes persulcatus]
MESPGTAGSSTGKTKAISLNQKRAILDGVRINLKNAVHRRRPPRGRRNCRHGPVEVRAPGALAPVGVQVGAHGRVLGAAPRLLPGQTTPGPGRSCPGQDQGRPALHARYNADSPRWASCEAPARWGFSGREAAAPRKEIGAAALVRSPVLLASTGQHSPPPSGPLCQAPGALDRSGHSRARAGRAHYRSDGETQPR